LMSTSGPSVATISTKLEVRIKIILLPAARLALTGQTLGGRKVEDLSSLEPLAKLSTASSQRFSYLNDSAGTHNKYFRYMNDYLKHLHKFVGLSLSAIHRPW
jgi:hypothetical protein